MPIRRVARATFGIVCGSIAYAGPVSALLISSQAQYATVIQGGIDPITAKVYNTGSAPDGYMVTGAYGYNYAYGFPYFYEGTLSGNSFTQLPFNLNTANLPPGDTAVKLTLTDLSNGFTLSQGNSILVLAHSAPALYVQNQILTLSSQTVVVFTAPVFAEAAPGGTEAAGGAYSPQMLGDPPGEPTAELDLDSVVSMGSPYINTTLAPFTDLPSNDNPAQGLPFQIDFNVPADGDYSTTFVLYYSDEQDLPGAAPPGSEMASFNVNIDVTPDLSYWTITTDVLPEPSTGDLTGILLCLVGILRHLGRTRGSYSTV